MNRKRFMVIRCLMAVTLIVLGSSAGAQVGTLDPSFGDGGIRVTHQDEVDYGRGVLVRPDGSILVGGSSGDSSFSTTDSTIWSYQDNGAPIESVAIRSEPFGCNVVPDLFLVMSDDAAGRVLASGWAQFDCGGIALDFWTVRYTPGVSVEHFERPVFYGHTDLARAILELSDGRVVAAGQAGTAGGSWDFAFAGFDVDGTLDGFGFGTGGETVVDVGAGTDIVHDLGELSDGRIVGVGTATVGGQEDAAIVRLGSDGTVDEGFGNGGVATFDLDSAEAGFWAVVVLPDDSVLAAGRRGDPDTEFVVVKLDAEGGRDPQFGSDGVVVVGFGGTSAGALAMLVQSDDKIVVAGYSEGSPGGIFTRDIAVARLHSNGVLDSAFGTGGRTLVSVGPDRGGVANAVTSDADGNYLIAGYATDIDEFSDVVLVRLVGDDAAGLLFASGFETGGYGEWSSVVP